jgi:tetratricopeptide (TPR) repeat protein
MPRTSTGLWRRYQGIRALCQWGCIAIGFVAAFHLDGHRLLAASLFCGSVIGYLGLPRLAWRRIYLGAHARFVDAFRRDDAIGARRVYDQLAAIGYSRYPGYERSEAWVLMLEERWQDAYDFLSRAELPSGRTEARARELNERAWCLAQLGRATEAIPLANEALAAGDEHLRPYARGTLGTALHLAGNHEEATRCLEKALAEPGPQARAQAARAYYLGEALQALGRTAEACVAYQRAIDEAAFSRYAQRAAERLRGMPAAPAR